MDTIKIPQAKHTKASGLADPDRFYKAAENRVWALYLSCPVLVDRLAPAYFSHWSTLVVILRYLSGCEIDLTAPGGTISLSRCEEVLKKWVRLVPVLYAPWALSHAVHHVQHLCRHVDLLGPMWAINCFAFETFNSYIRRNVHGRKGGFADEFTEAFLFCQELRYRIDKHVSPQDSDVCELLSLCGYKPLSYSNAFIRKTWLPTGSPSVFLMPPLARFPADSDVATKLNSFGQSEVVRGGMLSRDYVFFHSRASRETAQSSSHFSSCVLLEGTVLGGAVGSQALAIVEAFYLHCASGRCFAEVLIQKSTTHPTPFEFGRIVSVDMDRDYVRFIVPESSILMPVWWVQKRANNFAYAIDFVHYKSAMDNSVPLRKFFNPEGGVRDTAQLQVEYK